MLQGTSSLICCIYFSYHQKYILRQHDEIFDSLNLSNEDLITSDVAARLNGYLGGYSTIGAFEEVL